MARRPRLEKLTISLFKDGVEPDVALREPSACDAHTVPVLQADAPSLFVKARPPHPPRWTSYLAGHVSSSLGGLLTASASAALLLQADSRLFAITFGQGRYLLDFEALEPDFGLRVALNTVAPDQLKSVDAKTIEETTVHTRRDVSRDSAFSAFGLDPSRDLLRAVTGTPRDDSLAHRLTGADSLGITTRAKLPEVRTLAARLLDAYEDDAYKEHFEFIDHLRPEKNPAQLRELDDALVNALATRAIGDAHLAAPETLDWVDVAGFRFSSVSDESELDNDPRISLYLDSREGQDIDLAMLKEDRLLAMRASSDQVMAAWPIYRCIVFQIETGGALYVLSGGQWFRVDLAYKNKTYNEVNALPRLTGLPDADAGTDENAYNTKAAMAMGALCLDKKFVFDGGPDKMEICDILTRERQLIHVKHRGSSSTLSHLFAQGVNSAERLLLDEDFRAQARFVVAREDAGYADVIAAERPDANDYEVCFVVITRSDRETPLTLPFFSVVSLRTAASRLRGYGFRVAVAAVREAQ